MPHCPSCSTQKSHALTQDELFIEFCHDCGLLYVDFGVCRPRLYQQIEKQAERWEHQVNQSRLSSMLY